MQKKAKKKSRLNRTNSRIVIGFIPLLVFAVLIGYLAINNPFGNTIYNPPNLLSLLNTVFVTGTGTVIAIISAISYMKSGRLNILLLGCGVLAGGLASLIGGYTANITANYGVTTHNTGMLLASSLQVASAIITLLYISPNKPSQRKIAIVIGYLAIIIFFVALTWLTLNNFTPIFFEPSGATVLRQIVLGLSIVFFSLSSLLFFIQYVRSKNTGLYWYSIGLALFAIGMIGIVFQQRNADVFVWVGRAAQYAGGFYFIIAVLSLRNTPEKGIPLAERWIGIFSADRRQLSTFFSKLSEGFIYGKVITGSNGEPIDFIFLDANDSYERIRAATRAEIIGKKATDIFSAFHDDPNMLIRRYGEVALRGVSTTFEIYSTASDKWYHVSSYCPEPGYFIAILEDITERKKAEEALKESEELYRTIFDNSEDGFQLVKPTFDESGNPIDYLFLSVNQAYERQVGLKAEQVVGKTVREIVPNIEPEWIETHGEVAKTGKSLHREIYNDFSKRWYDLYYFRYKEGQVGVLFRDITARKEMEKLLYENERLATIGQTAGMVGHDIRNPLQAIVSELYLAKETIAEATESKCKQDVTDSLDFIQQQIDYINKIVADLQDYARNTKPSLTQVNLKELVENAFSAISVPENIEAVCNIEPNLKIKSDHSYLRRIITNLSNNAIQAMPKGGKLTLTIKAKNESVEITVNDTGEGIPDDLKERMFKPLFTTKAKGQGFGLAVVKKFVEQLGGTITFDSQVGKGTKFIIKLPQA